PLDQDRQPPPGSPLSNRRSDQEPPGGRTMTRSKRGRKANGEGSIYQRRNGSWGATAFVLTTDGTPKRKFVYGKTRDEAHEKLTELKARSQQGIPIPNRSWRVAEYLRYWLRVYVSELRPKTAEGYEAACRLHLIPELGRKRLDGLQVQHVKAFLDALKRKCL